jgi:chromosomal replication initiation ATPase DnaA
MLYTILLNSEELELILEALESHEREQVGALDKITALQQIISDEIELQDRRKNIKEKISMIPVK